MGNYEHLTREELLARVMKLEKEVGELSSRLDTFQKQGFREKYSTRILDALPDMLTVFDHDANIVELASSPATNHVEGTTATSIVGSNVKDIVPEEAYESVRANMDCVINTGKSSIAKHSLQLEGTWHHYENRIFPLDEKYLLCLCRDVSERVEMEAENARQQAEIYRLNSLMNSMLSNVPVYMFMKDVNDDFRYLYWNQAFVDFSGVPVEQAIGKTDFEIFSGRADVNKFREDDIQVLEAGRLEYIEEMVDANGEVRYMKTIKTLVPSGDQYLYIIGIVWDLTDIKKAEQELIAAREKAEDSDRLKSAFLANMSHEIRTPLNAIVGFSKLIIDSPDTEDKRLYSEIVEKNSKLLLNLFNDILDLSALEAGSLTFSSRQIKLHDVCLQLYQMYAPSLKQDVRFVLDDADTGLYVRGDWDRIYQIWTNLISNAIKFTPKGEIHFGFELKEGMVQCYVKDTGIGIPKERISVIFERFGKLNDFVQGSGLGLALCRMLVEKMGGRIWGDSNVGQGTVFYFTLPID